MECEQLSYIGVDQEYAGQLQAIAYDDPLAISANREQEMIWSRRASSDQPGSQMYVDRTQSR